MFSEDPVTVTFHGQQVVGKYGIFRTRNDNWLVYQMASVA